MTIYCFHEIGYQDNEWCVTPEEFIAFAKKHTNDWVHFDDGRKGIYTYWPVIAENLRYLPMLFIVPNFLNGDVPEHEAYSDFMSVEDIKTLINFGFRIGSHGLSHVSLAKLEDDELFNELFVSKNNLENLFNIEIKNLSLPYGHSTDKAYQTALDNGYTKIYKLKGSPGPGIERTLVTKANVRTI